MIYAPLDLVQHLSYRACVVVEYVGVESIVEGLESQGGFIKVDSQLGLLQQILQFLRRTGLA